jgi:F-type H+-transporting ATPase subunit delta
MRETPQQFADAWYEAVAEATAKDRDAMSERFLAELHHSGRLNWLPEIERRFAERDRAERGAVAVTVRRAHDVADHAIKAAVRKLFPDQPVDLESIEDPALIGGVQIETLDERWDYSVRGQLHQLEKELTH